MSALPGASARVVRAMELEILRQQKGGQHLQASGADQYGHVRIQGVLDLAALAEVTELAMKREFKI